MPARLYLRNRVAQVTQALYIELTGRGFTLLPVSFKSSIFLVVGGYFPDLVFGFGLHQFFPDSHRGQEHCHPYQDPIIGLLKNRQPR